MKRSPSSSPPPPSSSSSSSSCIQSSKPRVKRSRAKGIKNSGKGKIDNPDSPPSSGRRSSVYRGVTRHRWTGRFEAHLWDKSTWNSIQNKRGRQIYLGAYDNEEAAARTYDLAALKYWGTGTTLNFPIGMYENEIGEMEKLSKEEYLASLRRRSSGFSRGVSKYRGVARHHHNGRWEARIGRVLGNKYLYLGTYSTQEEAAAAYDLAAIEYRGPNAVTNFDISCYADRLNNIHPGFGTQFRTKVESSAIEPQADRPPEANRRDEWREDRKDGIRGAADFMESLDEHENEHPWNLCLETSLDPLLVSEILSDGPCELPSLFDETGFEDDIDFIFDGPESNEEGSGGAKGDEGVGSSPSPSLSSSSTTTSVYV